MIVLKLTNSVNKRPQLAVINENTVSISYISTNDCTLIERVNDSTISVKEKPEEIYEMLRKGKYVKL